MAYYGLQSTKILLHELFIALRTSVGWEVDSFKPTYLEILSANGKLFSSQIFLLSGMKFGKIQKKIVYSCKWGKDRKWGIVGENFPAGFHNYLIIKAFYVGMTGM